jgi:hypothetical protein
VICLNTSSGLSTQFGESVGTRDDVATKLHQRGSRDTAKLEMSVVGFDSV